MNIRTVGSILGAALFIGCLALPADADSGISVGPAISSTGLGVSLGYELVGGNVVLRAQSGNFTINPNFNANGNAYQGHLNLNNVLVDAEIHPLAKSFYVAVGGFINNNNVTASSTSAGVTIGGTNYGAGTVNAKVTWQNLAPFVGIGFAPVHGGFGFDVGAAFQGNARAAVTTNIAGVAPSDILSAQTQIQNAVNGFTVYPVVSLRYTFGF